MRMCSVKLLLGCLLALYAISLVVMLLSMFDQVRESFSDVNILPPLLSSFTRSRSRLHQTISVIVQNLQP